MSTIKLLPLVPQIPLPKAETIALMVPPNPPSKTLISLKVVGIDVEAMVGDVEVEVDVVTDLEGARAIIVNSSKINPPLLGTPNLH